MPENAFGNAGDGSVGDGSFRAERLLPRLASAADAGHGDLRCCCIRARLSPRSVRTLDQLLRALCALFWILVPASNTYSLFMPAASGLGFDNRYWLLAAAYVPAVLLFLTQARLVLPERYVSMTLLSSVGQYSAMILLLDIVNFGFSKIDIDHLVFDVVYDGAAWAGCILINYNAADSGVIRIAKLATIASCLVDIWWYTNIYGRYFDEWEKDNSKFLLGAAKVGTDLLWYRAVLELACLKLIEPRSNLFVRHEFLLLPLDEPLPTACLERRRDIGSVHRDCPHAGKPAPAPQNQQQQELSAVLPLFAAQPREAVRTGQLDHTV